MLTAMFPDVEEGEFQVVEVAELLHLWMAATLVVAPAL